MPHWRVLLIEAGIDEPTGTQVPSMFLNFLGSTIDWGFKTEPEEMACLSDPEKRCYWPRGKVIIEFVTTLFHVFRVSHARISMYHFLPVSCVAIDANFCIFFSSFLFLRNNCVGNEKTKKKTT